MSFLIAGSESTQKVGFIRSFLPSWHFFGGSYPPVLFLPPKQDFAVREQQIGFAINRPQIRKIQGRKHIPSRGIFFKFEIHYVRHTVSQFARLSRGSA